MRRPGLVAMQQWRDLPLVLARCLIVLHSGSLVRSSFVRSLRSNQLDTTQDGSHHLHHRARRQRA